MSTITPAAKPIEVTRAPAVGSLSTVKAEELLQLTRAVLAAMRERGNGPYPAPGWELSCATRFAVQRLSEREHVQLLAPGLRATGFRATGFRATETPRSWRLARLRILRIRPQLGAGAKTPWETSNPALAQQRKWTV